MNTGEFEFGMPKYEVTIIAISRCSTDTAQWLSDLMTPTDKTYKSRIEAAIRIARSWRLPPGGYPRCNAIEFMARFNEAHTQYIIRKATERLTA